MINVPYKSVAAALVLAVLFGPIGTFYSSFLGGVVMSILGLVSFGAMTSLHSSLFMTAVWLLSVLWSMVAVRFYNRKMLKIAIHGCLEDSGNQPSFFRKKATVDNVSASKAEDDAAASWKL